MARLQFHTPEAGRRLRNGAVVAVSLLALTWALMVPMPGRSYRGPLPDLNNTERRLEESLHADLQHLAGDIGERNVFCPNELAAAADWLEAELQGAGYTVTRQTFEVLRTSCSNLTAELPGTSRPDEIVVVGGHYDSVAGSPGANDNGTGAVATLALARLLAGRPLARTVRFVEWVNEEPPFFWTADMGSLVDAKACRERGDRVVCAFSLETMGYYTNEPDSQHYIKPLNVFYPSVGDFIGVVGDVTSRRLVRRVVGTFRQNELFPCEGVAGVKLLPGFGWSDHWSYWHEGYPAVMVTDTAVFRYPLYHQITDTPDKIDYNRLARVVNGLVPVITDLAGP